MEGNMWLKNKVIIENRLIVNFDMQYNMAIPYMQMRIFTRRNNTCYGA